MNTETLDAQVATADPTPTVLTEVKNLAMPDMALEVRRADSSLRMAISIQVASAEDYQLAAEELAVIKGRKNALEAKRTSVAGPLHKAWTALNQMFKAPMDALTEAETAIKNAMLAYSNEQERLATIARREAEALAATERQRLADEARRIEQVAAAERQRIADEEAARVRAANADRDRLLAEAAAAQQAGDAEAAAALDQQIAAQMDSNDLASQQAREQAEEVDQAATAQAASIRMESAVTSAPVVRIAPVAARGVSRSVTWDYELVDIKKVIDHIAKNPDLAGLLVLDSVKTRAYVRSLGENCKVPGLNVFQKATLSSRAA